MLGLGPFAFLLQLGFGAEAQISFAFTQQALGMFAINFQTVGLAIRSVRAADIGAFVPVQAEPLEIGNELIFKAGFAAFDVGIFDAQHHGAAIVPGEKPVEQSGTTHCPRGAVQSEKAQNEPERENLESPEDVSRSGGSGTCSGDLSRLRTDRELAAGRASGLFFRRHVGSGDSIVPAELIFVEQAPGISQAERHPGKHGCQHPPAAYGARHRIAVKSLQLEFGQLQARRGAAVNQQKILVGAPERSDQEQSRSGHLGRAMALSFVILKKM